MLRAQHKPPREHARPPHEAPVVVGKIVGPYGLKGWLKVASFTEPADNVLGYLPWHLEIDGRLRAVDVESARRHGNAYVAKIRGIEDRHSAQTLANALIAIDATALPRLPANEFYWKDLIGMTVVQPDGAQLGRVVELIETGANDVLVVEGDAGRRLIPFVAAVIGDVDIGQRRLVADWREPAEG